MSKKYKLIKISLHYKQHNFRRRVCLHFAEKKWVINGGEWYWCAVVWAMRHESQLKDTVSTLLAESKTSKYVFMIKLDAAGHYTQHVSISLLGVIICKMKPHTFLHFTSSDCPPSSTTKLLYKMCSNKLNITHCVLSVLDNTLTCRQ